MTDQSISKQVRKYKLVFIGDQSVGKSSIINRFMYDNFTGTQQPTVGIDFVAKTLHLENKTIRLQLWDTAGQERFRSLIPSYIRDSDAGIIVYDTTNLSSFQNLNKWLDYVREERGKDVLIVLLANKIDLADQRQVSTEDGNKFATEQGLLFFEVSAKDGNNIQNVFKQISYSLLSSDKQDITVGDNPNNNNIQQKQQNIGGNIQLTGNNKPLDRLKEENKKCC
ncbi:ras oncogene family protein, putative [Ichthyophthirius multifiliis]|uniref:Ras oncogene family protein, putative n=1 Tax=Ichthyophthirius multifiliis TaxID=5932 RepID=G0QSP4_ICHMU|nr:ras oncogene family protein, putative [Ichthyophthirius multifiliis]EGR31760.1 ras oncogene family protein, putative [Ichthyophthirius multifiliis]|eukprot:XP_004035246.1 ras oncogene family protein, putative [Ichthyophthirius multifiliis]